MSLPACQQRALDRIDDALRAREPRMAARFEIFGQLTRGEGFPAYEQLGKRSRARLVSGSRALLLFPLALLAVTLALLGSSLTGAQACTPSRVRFATAASGNRACPPGSSRPLTGAGPGSRARLPGSASLTR